MSKNLAFQLRAMRDEKGWSQQELAEKVRMNQNAISRLENPSYGKATITTLKRLAAIFDVAVVVRFVPFSQLINWVSGTAFVDRGLSTESLAVPSFAQEIASMEAIRENLPPESRYTENVPTGIQLPLNLLPPNVIWIDSFGKAFEQGFAAGISQPQNEPHATDRDMAATLISASVAGIEANEKSYFLGGAH